MNELDFLKEQSFKGSRITKAYSTHFEKSNITHICLRGDFLKGEYPYWDLYFNAGRTRKHCKKDYSRTETDCFFYDEYSLEDNLLNDFPEYLQRYCG